MKKEQAELLSRITSRLRELFTKDNLYRNGYFIYRMNSQLEFPMELLSQQLRPITSRGDLIMKAILNTEFMEYLADKKRVRLKYKGSSRIVVVTGIKKSFLEEMINQFKGRNKNNTHIRIIPRKEKYEIETVDDDVAALLKKFLREKKRTYDYNEDYVYKSQTAHKIRIVIEREELYTLLLDSIFEEERININAKFNDKTSPYEPILVNGYYGNDFREDQDEPYSQDKTSNLSQTQEHKFYQDLIETQEVSTQLTQNQESDIEGHVNHQVVLYNEAFVVQPVVKEQTIEVPIPPKQLILQTPKKQIIIEENKENSESPKTLKEIASHNDSPEKQIEESIQSSQDSCKQQVQVQIQQNSPGQQQHSSGQQQTRTIQQQPNVYSFEFIDDLYHKLIKQKKLLRPDALNIKANDVAAEDENRKKFFEKLYEKNIRRRKKFRNDEQQS